MQNITSILVEHFSLSYNALEIIDKTLLFSHYSCSIEGLVSSEVGGKYQMWVFTTNEYVLFCLMKAGRIESNQCGPFSGYLSSRVCWRLKGRRVRRGTILATRLNAIMGLSSPRPPGCWGDSWRQRRGTRPVRWA